jgi:hypothetical protein
LSGDTTSYLKRVLRESLAAMEDLEQAAPGLSDDAFVFGSSSARTLFRVKESISASVVGLSSAVSDKKGCVVADLVVISMSRHPTARRYRIHG